VFLAYSKIQKLFGIKKFIKISVQVVGYSDTFITFVISEAIMQPETKNKQMNIYSKYAPNVFLAKCEEPYEKGDVIDVETRYGKINESIVHNLIYEKNGYYFYSITRADGFNSQERAKRKAERLQGYSDNAAKRSNEYHEQSNEGADFLRLAEPIKVGHHSEKRHRALIERNYKRMGKSVAETEKARTYEQRAQYWEKKSEELNASMPESVEYFEFKLEQAQKKHQFLKDNPDKRSHSYSLTYAKKDVNKFKKKLKLANTLWG